MLHYDRTDKPYLTEHSGHCSYCDARFAADADLYMVPADDYAARSDMRGPSRFARNASRPTSASAHARSGSPSRAQGADIA
jgi:hypothetical protein